MKTVSIILTTYNSEKHIDRTLIALNNQIGKDSLFNLEIVVVDDCSVDSTKEILKNYHVQVYSTDVNSGGPNRGRNIGIEKASGDYLIILDHDDECLPDRIVKQLNCSHLAPIITGGFIIIYNNGISRSIVRNSKARNNYIFYRKNETFIHKISKTKNSQNTYLGSIMFHKSLKHIKFEEHFGQIDFDWVAKIFEGNSSVEVTDVLYNRYVYGSNLSLDKTYRIRDYYYSLLTLENYVDRYPKEVRIGRKRINGTFARYYYLSGEMKKARHYFIKSEFNLKTILYLITSFLGHRFVVKNFNIFG